GRDCDRSSISGSSWPSADCTATCANGENLELMGKFKSLSEYGGVKATGDVYIICNCSSRRVFLLHGAKGLKDA
ncbi:hypothetical protein PENTCL1PPCAC_26170, partial [Pristionchus entomophagus]